MSGRVVVKKKPTISLCMIVRNEEKLLARCLASVKRIVAEIVIVDTGSTDRTKAIARACGARIVSIRWRNDFLVARNVYLKLAKCDWIMTLDADECIAQRDLGKVEKMVLKECVSGYEFPVRNYINESNILQEWRSSSGQYPEEEICSGWFLSKSLRLFKNRRGLRYDGCLLQPDVKDSLRSTGGRIRESMVPIHHHSRLKFQDMPDIKKKQMRYLFLSVKSLKRFPRNSYLHFNIANILFLYTRGNNARALAHLKKAITLNPGYIRSYWLMALVYQKQKNFSAAESALNAALGMRTRTALTYALLGAHYLKCLDLTRAEKFLKKSLAIDNGCPEAHFSLATLYRVRGDLRHASAGYARVLTLNRNHTYAHRARIEVTREVRG